MKKYNQTNKRAVLMGIIIPILLFFISMNVTFAFFTATAKGGGTEKQTAILKINFSDESAVFANSQPITESVRLLPGDTLNTTGTIVNESNVPVYSIISFKIFATKQGSSVVETLKDTYYTFSDSNIVEITESNGTYIGDATTLEAPNADKSNNCKKDFTLSHTFDFYQYGNEYKNATVTYSIKAHAIQVYQISNGAEATQILMNRFNIINQYQQVEYIESTGTQYIDTKFIPNQNTSILMDYQLTEVTASFLFGTRTRNENSAYVNSYTLNIASNGFKYVSYYNKIYETNETADTNRHIVYKNKNILYMDDVAISTVTKSDFTAIYSLNMLACCHVGTNGYLPSKAKVYGFAIYNNNTLIKKFMPCYRVSDGEVGMLDIVNNEFYSNSGTGEFLKGNNV